MIDFALKAREFWHQSEEHNVPLEKCGCYFRYEDELINLLQQIHQETLDEIDDKLGDGAANLASSFSFNDPYFQGFLAAYDMVVGKKENTK